MKLENKFKEYLADICIKIFQIVFAMLVVGVFLREKFEFYVFFFGIIVSSLTLTMATLLYYNATQLGK